MFGTLLASSPIFNAFVHSDFFGKQIFFALFILSILSWVILSYKIWLIYKAKKFARQFKGVMEKKKTHFFFLDKFVPLSFKEPINAFLEIYLAFRRQTMEVLKKNRGLGKELLEGEQEDVYLSPSDVDYIGDRLHVLISVQRKSLEKYLFFLSTVVSLAPFLGLLGTVWGILVTFGDLQAHVSGNANEMILGGLSMALATTVLGLLVAIPSLISHGYLKQSVRDFETDMENFSDELLATVEMLYRKVDVV